MKETSAQTMLFCALVLLLWIVPREGIEVRDEHGNLIFCGSGNLHYTSRNSIYGVAVTEAWAVHSGEIWITRVTSVPRVLDYYGLDSYHLDSNGLAISTPTNLHYSQIRMKLTPQGEQRLEVGRWKLELSQNFSEGQVVIIKPRQLLGGWQC